MPHPLRLTAKLLRTAAAVLTMTLFFLSCATPQEKKLVKDGVTLKYSPKSFKVAELKNIRFDHPAKITQEQIRNHLLSLNYQQLSFFGKNSPVYSTKDVDRISQLLARAFSQVPADSIISYQLKTAHGKTEGEAFFSHNKINWRFQTIRGLSFINSSSSNIRGTLASLWRLVPQRGQRIYVSDQLIGKKQWDNWIVANLNLPAAQNRNPKKKKRTAKKNNRSKKRQKNPAQNPKGNPQKQEFLDASPELEQKLKFLKNLREKNLIDEKEFERKRQELLDRFL